MKAVRIPLLLALTVLQGAHAAIAPPEQALTRMRPQLTNNIARPLRYWPIAGDFVVTNGAEFFNRPLYCDHSAFRIDGGDKPEFSLYLPGRGGNLRLGIKTAAGVKWLNDAKQVIARYRAGSLIYEIRDPLLGNSELDLTILPLSGAKGLVAQVECKAGVLPAQRARKRERDKSRADFVGGGRQDARPTLIFAFGGANGMRGRRGGDIGCERQPITEFFQLRPEECRGNQFSIATNTFVLRAQIGTHGRDARATIAGIFPPDSKLAIADASKWDSAGDLLASAESPPSPRPSGERAGVRGFEFPVVLGQTDLPKDKPVYFALRQVDGAQDSRAISAGDLPKLFSAAEDYRRKIAGQVTVQTPDPFINAAVPALNVAADAIWDSRQKAFMHGAVAWRRRLLGWRGPYAGDALGWHERTAEHFAGFAREQNTNPIPGKIPPADENSNLARNEKALHSNGDLTKSHYDMNLVAVDAFFRHLLWTGDTNYARKMWPVIERHFAWEKRLFRREFGGAAPSPLGGERAGVRGQNESREHSTSNEEKLPLYEAYAAIWASDNLSYNGGGTAHASAYNFFANKMAARVAKMIGKDPAPYEREADLIRRAMQKYLWLTNDGCFAEYKDYLGLQLVHPNGGLWTFYIPMDSEVPTPAEAWQMSRWVDQNIAHIPIVISGSSRGDEAQIDRTGTPSLLTSAATEKRPFVLPESNWMPYEWSLNNVVVAENVHTALGFWEANRPETAFALFKGALLDTMFLGLCPGNVGCMTSHDAARGEAQRDFGDGIGITARALVEGLFGVKPDAFAGELKIVPGFPADWSFASIRHPDFSFEFRRDGLVETYSVESKFPKPMSLQMQIPALRSEVAGVTVNGVPAKWSWVEGLFGVPRIEIRSHAAESWKVDVTWKGSQMRPRTLSLSATSSGRKGGRRQGEGIAFDWNRPFPVDAQFDAVSLAPFFNDRVTQIFKNKYLSPRSPFCSLAMPDQGIGGWADCFETFDVDDSGLRSVAARHGGKIVLPDGVPFETPTNAGVKNIIFTSQWDHYPDAVSVPLTGRSSRAFLLMAGSTGPMQSRFDNGEVVVTYADGSTATLPLRNPTNWWPIDQDYFIDDFAFRRPQPIPPRVDLKTGKIRILDVNKFKGKGGKVPGGAATVLELPLDQTKELKSLTIRALANEVVIGLMAVTLER